MSAKIHVTKEIQQAFNLNHRAITDMGLYASSALMKVCPECVTPKRVLARTTMHNEGHFVIELGYTLENIPAHGTWYFSFMFKTSLSGTVTVTKTTDSGIYTKSCKFDREALDEIVKEIAEE